MSFTSSPNMNLPVPVVGDESGPQYAIDINSCFSLLDTHDHTSGKGVQITPNGLNINTALSMQTNFLTNVAGVTFTAQGSTPALNTIYEAANDLYFVDGVGNNVRITQNGSVAGAPGSIANLTAPASASYVSGSSTFVWQSNTNVAANMDFGSAIFRNLVPNSTNGITVQAPASLASNYTISLPTLPASQSFLAIDNSGNMSAPTVFPLTNSGIANSTIQNAKFAAGTQVPVSVTSITTTYTALITDGLILAGVASPYTVTLYSAASNPGLTLKIKKTSNDFNVLTISDAAGFTTTLNTQGESIVLQATSTGWELVDRYIPAGWIEYFPDFTSFGIPINVVANYRRQGPNIVLQIKWTNGTNTNVTSSITLPTGLLIDSVLLSRDLVGEGAQTGTISSFNVIVDLTSAFDSIFFSQSSGNYQTKMTGNTFDSGAVNTIFATIPIDGWNG